MSSLPTSGGGGGGGGEVGGGGASRVNASTSVTFRAKLLPTVCRVPSLFYSGGGEVGGGGASRVKTAIYIQIQIQSQNAGGLGTPP